ncbi:MAG: hypothetical protein MUF45_09510 [Spirosomaceae bacterium]|jgi:hypothetical protein|nr:hypothetical protein [Spirosomataceae bacterium]
MKFPLSIIKIFNYEYWPWWVFYLPMAPYWLYLSLKTRSLTFFTAVNPGIEAGGFYGEKKMEILKNINPKYLPKTTFIHQNQEYEKAISLLNTSQIMLPFIAKPNIGERGTNVAKIESWEQFKAYHAATQEDYIVQEFITYPLEFGVLFSRLPNQQQGKVSSLTMKEFLTVVGDGKSTIRELIENSTRARFQLEVLESKLGEGMNEILPKDEKRLLEPIGNHCRGTKFINANHLINSKLDDIFSRIAENFDGFYYGRFDMKVASIEDLYRGENIRIMELNGVSSDPGHIYDPDYRLWNAYRDLRWHWKRSAEISIQNRKRGFLPLPFGEIWAIVQKHLL